MDSPNPKVEVFNRDIEGHEGYIYTTSKLLSSQMATQRSKDIILSVGSLAGRSVLDMGCGDGYYAIYFWDYGRPKTILGVDAAEKAIGIANNNKLDRPIEFMVGDVHSLPYPDDSFDLALVQSILHHDDSPLGILKEAFRLAPEILIHEPNGNNLGLKAIEKVSTYHREHQEKSYSSIKLKKWVKEAGGRVTVERFAGFVPMFCPSWLARAMKIIEPMVESLPLIRTLACSVYVIKAKRR